MKLLLVPDKLDGIGPAHFTEVDFEMNSIVDQFYLM